MATKKPETIEAFVLLDCQYGKCGTVVELPIADAEIGVANGMLDVAPAAVAHAKG